MNREADFGFFTPTNLWRLVWLRRTTVGSSAVVGVFLALLFAIVSRPVYQATMTVGPPDDMQTGGAGANGGGVLGQLGQFAGIQVNSAGENQVQMYRLLMSGTRVAARMENRYHLLEQMLPEAWNAQEKRWKERSEVHLGIIGYIKETVGLLHWSKPTSDDLATLIGSHLLFTQIPKSSFYMISYNDRTPQGAVKRLSDLSQATDEVYNEGLAKQTQARIEYTDNMLRTETRTSVREAQMRLLDQYSNRLIGLHSGQSLLVEIVQPPTADTIPIWPRPSLMIILGAVIGFLVGLLLAVFLPIDLSVKAVVVPRVRSLFGRIVGTSAARV